MPRHIHVQVAIDQDVFHRRVGQQVFDRSEAGQLLGQRLGDLPHLGLVDGNAAHAGEALDLQVHEALDGAARPPAELGAKLLDAGQQVLVRGFLDVLEGLRDGKRAVARVGLVGELDGLCHVAFRSVVRRSSSAGSVGLRLKRSPSRARMPAIQPATPGARSPGWV